MRIDALVLTCEHGGNDVPAGYRRLFEGPRARAALRSHRGYDIGALQTARSLGRRFRVPVIHGTVTRLLVELNRSVGHPRLFSEFAAGLDGAERERVLRELYYPHRERVQMAIHRHARLGRRTLHVSVHSFTPVLGNRIRAADLGLLYDPGRASERRFCARWQAALASLLPELRVRRNYPYRGSNDGLTTVLRRVFGPREYLGIEIEANQALLVGDESRRRIARGIGESLSRLLGGAGDRRIERSPRL